MTEPDFLKEWHSNFPSFYQQMPPNRDRIRLNELAAEYHQECDAFDDRICSGKHKGTSFPMTPAERREIEANARRVRDTKLAEAMSLGFTQRQFQEALLNNAT